jgi:hypothetical protein
MPDTPRNHRDLLEACLGLRPASEADDLAHQAETTVPAAADAENLYYHGSLFADCGKKQAAIRLLQAAIDQNYCSYTNLQLDPMLRKVRQAPGFEKLLTSAEECQRAIKAPSNSELAGP